MSKLFTFLMLAVPPFSLDGMENKLGSKTSELHRELKNYKGDPKKIDDLLEAGADPNAYFDPYISCSTPLGELAIHLGITVMLEKANDNKSSPVIGPSSESLKLAIKVLLDHGADIYKTQKVLCNNGKKYVEVEKSNYDLLKPLMPNLNTIIEKVAEDKRKTKKLAADLKIAVEQNKQTNRSITIKDKPFKLSEAILSARCPKLLEFSL